MNQGNIFRSPSGCTLNFLRESLGIEEKESILPSRGADGDFHLVTLGLILLCYVLSGLNSAFYAVSQGTT